MQHKDSFRYAPAIDLEFNPVAARVMFARGEITNDLGFDEIDCGMCRQIEFSPFEDLFGTAAAGFDIMNDVVDGEPLHTTGA